MANYFATPPASWVIPVTKSCDRDFILKRKDVDGQEVSWGSLVYIEIDIDKENPTVVQADVVDAEATFLIESAVCDQVRNSTKWRIIKSEDNVETALAVGTFMRYDG